MIETCCISCPTYPLVLNLLHSSVPVFGTVRAMCSQDTTLLYCFKYRLSIHLGVISMLTEPQPQVHTHTHTRLTALCRGLPGWAGTRKLKPIWILLEQETMSGSGISRTICKSAPRCRQITTPAPHYSSFLQAGCPSCHPTNSVKALKAQQP